jgi:hypothetical protein
MTAKRLSAIIWKHSDFDEHDSLLRRDVCTKISGFTSPRRQLFELAEENFSAILIAAPPASGQKNRLGLKDERFARFEAGADRLSVCWPKRRSQSLSIFTVARLNGFAARPRNAYAR